MPTQKTLREIIINLINTSEMDVAIGDRWNRAIDQAISEIKSLLKGKLPEKNEYAMRIWNKDIRILKLCEQDRNIGYNQALTEIKQILEAL